MKDQRVAAFRKVLTSLLDSLDATVRVARWSGPEAIPTPLENSAAKLLDHLGSANRLAADRYLGSPPVVACMTAMSAATKVLDGAYVEYRRHIEAQKEELDQAAIALLHEIDGVKSTSDKWG
ncbi:hypothetical protein AKJ09_06793 [Labilithrix luteola]|uniref:Uncharacterized protein n=1 Tax=Labilithrix luteola TaxID=1391654 RepID=A0A0K1Q416_9BACT|nr:hypothetical protein [Labilithrix luteola]AKV00130.1 hypothetical protein AKJ09_06793 [Labilithrix luteola]